MNNLNGTIRLQAYIDHKLRADAGDEWSWLLDHPEFCIVPQPTHQRELVWALALTVDTAAVVGRGRTPEEAINCWRFWSEKLTTHPPNHRVGATGLPS